MNHLPRATARLVMSSRKMLIKKSELENKIYKSIFKHVIHSLQFLICLLAGGLILTWGGFADAQIKLKSKVPDLCYDCHKELKKDLSDSYVHFLFKNGKCVTCHNSHVSNVKALMNDDIDFICLSCHEKIRNLLKETTPHSALRDSVCTDCHNAHSGENKHLIIMAEKTLCLNCHEGLKEQLKKSYTCLPFKEGKCSSCHNSHASPEDDLLLDTPTKLCQECHGPKCKAKDVSIVSTVKSLDCTSCHSGHSSKDKGLLGPYGHTVFLIKNCEECHNPIERDDSKYKYIDGDVHVKDLKNPCNICHDYHASGRKNLTKNEPKICLKCHEGTEKRTVFMEKALRSIKCVPIKIRKCFECHIPTHSDLPLNYIADGITMCGRCHETQHKISHPQGPEIIDPRNGQPVTCISCHSMHSAKADYMLISDRNRALCIQCHKM
jgi:predicted CXXCH cytochrome family protein